MAKRRQARRGRPETPLPSRRRHWPWIVAVGVVLAVLAIVLRPSPRAPEPPVLDWAGFDPAVAEMLKRAVQNVRQEPDSSQAWGELGLALQNYERSDQARICLKRAQELAAEDPRWPFFLGMLALPKLESIGLLEQAAHLAGTGSDIPRLRLAQALADHGRLAEAAGTYSNLLSSQPTHALALLGLARVQVALKQLDEASETLRGALTDPHTARSAYELLAGVQQRLDRPEAADRARQIAASLTPDQKWPDPYVSEAARWRTGEQARVDHGQQLLQQGRISDALREAKRLVEEYPRSSEGWLLLARTRFENQDCPGAEAALRQHLQITPVSVNGLTQLGIALLCQQRYPEAAFAFTEALRHKPDLGQAHFNLGYSRAQQGELEAAKAAFEDAIRCNPDFVESYLALAELNLRLGNKVQAQTLFDQAARLRPADSPLEGVDP